MPDIKKLSSTKRRVIPMQKPGDETAPYWAINKWACPNLETARQRGLQAGMAVDFKCPNGHIGILRCHAIEPNGDVNPSVICPHGGNEILKRIPGGFISEDVDGTCDFHEFIKLEGWAEEK